MRISDWSSDVCSSDLVLVYTMWLKPRTPQNIVIGGAAGAFPPLIGWVAATGSVAPMPVLLFLLIFLWTPPHFWALALFVRSDYAAAGIPMMPVVAGERSTRRQIRSEEHTSELQSLMRISYAVFCLKKKKQLTKIDTHT